MKQSFPMSSDQETISSITINRILTNNYKLLKREQEFAIASIVVSVLCLLLFGGSMIMLIDFPDKQNIDVQFFMILILTLAVIGGVGMWLLLINGYVIGWHLFNRKKLYEILLIQSQIIRRSYLINFDLVEPNGKDRLEKIFNHLCLVFPQINEIKENKEN